MSLVLRMFLELGCRLESVELLAGWTTISDTMAYAVHYSRNTYRPGIPRCTYFSLL